MEKEFVTYEQALALKELGFDEPCFGWYMDNIDNDVIKEYIQRQPCADHATDCSAPLYQQAFRWFREKHNLCGAITPQSYEIWGYPDGECMIEQYPVNTYEEAESACLDKLIEIIKNKTND